MPFFSNDKIYYIVNLVTKMNDTFNTGLHEILL